MPLWTTPLNRTVLCASTVLLLAGCAGASAAHQAHQAPRGDGTASVEASTIAYSALPANSPLTACIDPTPAAPKPIDTAVAQQFANGRVRTTFSLDDGRFRAVSPPRDARPTVSAALAFCNLLAGATANNSSVLDAAAEHGLSFGLGQVTVADSVLRTGPRSYLVGGQQSTGSLQPYHAGLAWIAVIKPDVVASCPAKPATAATRPAAPSQALPAYQILAVDADTGTDGITYSARTNSICGFPGYWPAAVTPAVEFVSEPWTITSRGPELQSATIRYQRRPCDLRELGSFAGTGTPAVFADRAGVVGVRPERVLTSCGRALPTSILLRSCTLATNLPAHLKHARIGAQDVPGP